MAKSNKAATANTQVNDGNGKKAKTICPVSRADFEKRAKGILIEGTHDGRPFSILMSPKLFSTGSFGWHGGSQDLIMVVNGEPVGCVLNFLITCKNSSPDKGGK
jgi:hypothetical protein